MIDALMSKRVVVVSGKGGVGKSTICGAIALAARERGKRVMIAETVGAEAMAPLWGVEPAGYEGRELEPDVRAMSIAPAAAVDEYLMRLIRSRRMYEAIFRNRFVEPFMDAVMGLPDLITVGKVLDLEWERIDGSVGPTAQGPYRYDLIVVDAPATGHGMALLRSPRMMMDITQVGPLYNNARRVHDLLADHQRTGLVLVTLAEEMPISETEQAIAALDDDLDIELLGVVANAVPAPLLPAELEDRWRQLSAAGREAGGTAAAAVEVGERARRDRRRAVELLDRLWAGPSPEVVEVPRPPGGVLDRAALGRVAALLEATP